MLQIRTSIGLIHAGINQDTTLQLQSQTCSTAFTEHIIFDTMSFNNKAYRFTALEHSYMVIFYQSIHQTRYEIQLLDSIQ